MRDRSQDGIAAIEFALILPALALMLLVLVEGAWALKTQYTLVEASREGARLVVRQGNASNVNYLIETLTSKLPETAMTTSVDIDEGQQTVTVQVDYEYQPFFLDGSFVERFGSDPFVFRASTTMPLP